MSLFFSLSLSLSLPRAHLTHVHPSLFFSSFFFPLSLAFWLKIIVRGVNIRSFHPLPAVDALCEESTTDSAIFALCAPKTQFSIFYRLYYNTLHIYDTCVEKSTILFINRIRGVHINVPSPHHHVLFWKEIAAMLIYRSLFSCNF